MNSQLYEQIAYDGETNEFYISVKNLNNKEVERKTLESWNLVKEAKACLIVKRLLPSLGTLETETVSELYSVDLSYTVNPKAKHIYLKSEKFEQENGAVILKIFMRDVDRGQTQEVPVPSKLFNQDDFPEIEIKKTKGKLITTKEAVELLKSGTCLGIYSDDLTRRLIS